MLFTRFYRNKETDATLTLPVLNNTSMHKIPENVIDQLSMLETILRTWEELILRGKIATAKTCMNRMWIWFHWYVHYVVTDYIIHHFDIFIKSEPCKFDNVLVVYFTYELIYGNPSFS